MGEAIVPGRRLAAHLRLEMVPRLDFFFYQLLCLLPAPTLEAPSVRSVVWEDGRWLLLCFEPW